VLEKYAYPVAVRRGFGTIWISENSARDIDVYLFQGWQVKVGEPGDGERFFSGSLAQLSVDGKPIKKPRTKKIVAKPIPEVVIETQQIILSTNNTNAIDSSMNELDFEVVSDRIENIDDYNNNVQLITIDGNNYLSHANGSIYHPVTHQFIGQRLNGRVIFTK
jgi:hypothetical protein